MLIQPPSRLPPAAPLVSRPIMDRKRWPWPLVVAAALHAAVLALAIFWVRSQPPMDLSSAEPASFDVQFDAGQAQNSSPSPSPSQSAAAGRPDVPAPPVPLPPVDVPPASPPPSPPAPQDASVQPVPQPPTPPAPPQPAPPQPVAPPSWATPKADQADNIPLPPPVPVPEGPPIPPPPAPRPRVAAPRPRPANPFGDVHDWSFNAPPSQSPSQSPLGNYGARSFAGSKNEFATVRGANVGRDWMGQLSRWVHERWRYPEQAIERHEDGTTVAEMVVDKYGKVQDIRIVTPSGSQWLDAEILALFRHETLPPFPPGAADGPVLITLNMNYVLIRR